MNNRKHTLKRVFACAVVVFMAITATIMSGVVGIELPEWSEVFVTKASAETEGNLQYSVYNGKATITDYTPPNDGDLVIPDTLGGYPVTRIGNGAFVRCAGLTSVTIGNCSPELLAHIFYEKYAKAVPLERLSKDFRSIKAELSTPTLANWVIEASERYLKPFYEQLHTELLPIRSSTPHRQMVLMSRNIRPTSSAPAKDSCH